MNKVWLRTRRIQLIGALALVAAVGLPLTASLTLGAESHLATEPDVLEIPEWPAFTMVYEKVGHPTSLGDVTVRPREVHRIEWSNPWDWQDEIIDSEGIEKEDTILSRTGSWRKFSDGIYTEHWTRTGNTTSERIENGGMMLPETVLSPFSYLSALEAANEDPDIVVTAEQIELPVCYGSDCRTMATVVRIGATGKAPVGLFLPEGIPLEAGNVKVLEISLEADSP